MGQFYKTSYFKMQLKKIAEMPEDDHEGSSQDQTKSQEEDKSNSRSISNDLTKSNDQTKSTPNISKNSIDETSSMPSSVSSSKASSIKSPIKPFKPQEAAKRVSNISVESLYDYNKRKSGGKHS